MELFANVVSVLFWMLVTFVLLGTVSAIALVVYGDSLVGEASTGEVIATRITLFVISILLFTLNIPKTTYGTVLFIYVSYMFV